MFDESTELIAILVCGVGLFVFTVAMGIAAGRRHQADRRAELAAERERSR